MWLRDEITAGVEESTPAVFNSQQALERIQNDAEKPAVSR